MLKFLIKVAIFSAICLAPFAIGELYARRIPSSYSYKHEWMKQNSHAVSTLILGSSHTYYGVIPHLLNDSTFNLANISQTSGYDLALLKRWIDHMPNLKHIILSVSYFTYREEDLETISPYLCTYYKIAMDIHLHSNFSKYNFMISDYKMWREILRYDSMGKKINPCDSLGFGLGYDLSTRSGKWTSAGSVRAGGLTYKPNPQRVKEVIDTYSQILKLAKNHSIKCTFIYTPTWTTFREATDPIQLNEVFSLTDSLAHTFNAQFINLDESPLFTDEDFHDVDHLSDKGATKLTGILRQAIFPQHVTAVDSITDTLP